MLKAHDLGAFASDWCGTSIKLKGVWRALPKQGIHEAAGCICCPDCHSKCHSKCHLCQPSAPPQENRCLERFRWNNHGFYGDHDVKLGGAMIRRTDAEMFRFAHQHEALAAMDPDTHPELQTVIKTFFLKPGKSFVTASSTDACPDLQPGLKCSWETPNGGNKDEATWERTGCLCDRGMCVNHNQKLRQFSEIHGPCQMKPNSVYTWVIRNAPKGQLLVGHVQDTLELAVKHNYLAHQQRVIIAGEAKVNGQKVVLVNINSGSFMKKLFTAGTNGKKLATGLRNVIKKLNEVCKPQGLTFKLDEALNKCKTDDAWDASCVEKCEDFGGKPCEDNTYFSNSLKFSLDTGSIKTYCAGVKADKSTLEGVLTWGDCGLGKYQSKYVEASGDYKKCGKGRADDGLMTHHPACAKGAGATACYEGKSALEGAPAGK